MIEWTDGTSYSQRGERKQTCWTARIGGKDGMTISVLNNHMYYPGKWVMHFTPFFDAHPLGDEIEQGDFRCAQEVALRLARAKLAPIFKALDSAVTVL